MSDPFTVLASVTLTDSSGPAVVSPLTGYTVHVALETSFQAAIRERFRRGTETAQDRAEAWQTAPFIGH